LDPTPSQNKVIADRDGSLIPFAGPRPSAMKELTA
jgi:hypothetical protein